MTEPLMIRGRAPRSTAVALLKAQELPVWDITDEHVEHFSSLAPMARRPDSSGLKYLVPNAGSKSVQSIYLLTTPAEAFFKRLGYERIDRSQAPSSIERTRKFARLCSASSAFMVKSLWPSR